jgi:hypothetical protein
MGAGVESSYLGSVHMIMSLSGDLSTNDAKDVLYLGKIGVVFHPEHDE